MESTRGARSFRALVAVAALVFVTTPFLFPLFSPAACCFAILRVLPSGLIPADHVFTPTRAGVRPSPVGGARRQLPVRQARYPEGVH